MIKNEDIICISSIDWDFIWQGHQEIMTTLARNGNRVLFIENTGVRAPSFRDFGRIKNRMINWSKGVHGIRKIEEGLYVYSPLILPFPYLRVARFINKMLMFSILIKWLKAIGFSEPIVWAFLPTGLSLDLTSKIEPKILIYYCIDSFQTSSRYARKITRTERIMIKRADLVFATSHELFNHCRRYNANIHYFPFAVNIDNFMKSINDPTVPADIKGIARPIAGYVGGIHKWIDFDLIEDVANKNKNVSFVFCGPVQTDIYKIKGLSNVIFLGQKDPQKLPLYIKEFAIALIPYRITEYTRNVYPTKLNEYLSLGKRVVSTNLPEVIRFNKDNGNIVRIAVDRDAFSNHVRESLKLPQDENERSFAMNVAKQNSWSNRIEEMSSLIQNVIYEKMKEREKRWKITISQVYKNTRRRIIPITSLTTICYILVFHTPLLWFLASPLYIRANLPKRSDVIAVLGGGVGESGKVGQGHEERVMLAVNLYKGNVSNKIIYFSGYKAIMKEAQVMKALSIFLGVREDDILLNDTAVNTYEMVKDLEEVASKNSWKDVVIISSPYHMRRLNLVCNKYLKEKKVYLVPIEKSNFYARGQPIKLRQIQGVVHEYIAIIYYKIKGYM